MTKQSGLGDALLISGYDLSGDIGSVNNVGGGYDTLPSTGINKSAMERMGGVRDGRIEYMAYFNPATNQAHARLSTLPTSDQILTYCRGTTLGDPAACIVAKQLDYPGTRGDDGSYTFNVQAVANGYGLQWGRQLTAGLRTDTAATNGASIDTTASAAFGAQAFLHVTAFSGTDVTIKIQDSADDSSFADVTGLTFTQVTSGPTSERIATASGATIRRYLRVATVTTGGFTSATLSVTVIKNDTAVTF